MKETAMPHAGAKRAGASRSRRSRKMRSRKMRLAIPLLCLALAPIIFFLLMGESRGNLIGTPLSFAELSEINRKPRLIGLELNGFDAGGRPFRLSAEEARQMDGTRLIRLSGIRARMGARQGDWLAAEAQTGLLNSQEEKILIESDLSLILSSGYRLWGSVFQIDLQENSAESSKPVEAEGPLGTLRASGVAVEEAGDILRFRGPVRILLTLPQPGADAPSDSEEDAAP